MKSLTRVTSERLEPRWLLAANLVADVSIAPFDVRLLTSNEKIAYFAGRDAMHGEELWRTDGTVAGTGMVVDLAAGAGSAGLRDIFVTDNITYFTRVSGSRLELYRTNGSVKGTKRLLTRSKTSVIDRFSDVGRSTAVFTITESVDGAKRSTLFRTDGSKGGTHALVTFGAAPTDRAFSPGAGAALYEQTDGVWYTDGSTAGTRLLTIKDAQEYGAIASNSTSLYFSSRHDATITVHHVGQNAAISNIARFDSATLAGSPYGTPAWGVGSPTDQNGYILYQYKDKSLTDYGAGTLIEPALFSRVRPLIAGGNGDRFLIVGKDPGNGASPLYVYLNDDKYRFMRDIAVVPNTDDPDEVLDVAVTAGGLFIAQEIDGRLRVVRRQIETPDASSLYEDLLVGSAQPLRDADRYSYFVPLNGKLLFAGTDESGITRVNAATATSVTTLAGSRSSSADSTIHAWAMVGESRIIVHSQPGQTRVHVDLVDGGGQIHYLGGIDGGKAPSHVDLMRVPFSEVAFLGIDFGSRGQKFRLSRIDTEAKSMQLRYTAAYGALLGVPGAGVSDREAIFASSGSLPGSRLSGEVRMIGNPSLGLVSKVLHTIPGGSTLSFENAGQLIYIAKTSVYRTDWNDKAMYVGRAESGGSIITGVGTQSGEYFINPAGLYWLSGGPLSLLYTADQLAAGMNTLVDLRLSDDGMYVYGIAAKVVDDVVRDWTLYRFSTQSSVPPIEEVLRKPAAWTAATAPKIIAANNDDVVLRDTATAASTVLISQAGTVAKVEGIAEAVAYIGGLVLRSETGEVYRAENGSLARLNLVSPVSRLQGSQSEYQREVTMVTSTPATGEELFRFPLDTKITGNLFNDKNANRTKDPGERGLAGWRIYIDRNDNGRYDKGEVNTLTDSSGNYEFFELDPGTHKLRISTGANHQMTTGTIYTIKLQAGANVRKKFGARAIV